jgi:hypothetical protein
MSLHVWPQGVVQHPWDPMVEIPTLLERGCCRLNYVWICCSFAEYREYYHPRCGVLVIVHAQDVHDHPVDDICLAIHLGMEGSRLGQRDVQQWLEARPKCAKELAVPI